MRCILSDACDLVTLTSARRGLLLHYVCFHFNHHFQWQAVAGSSIIDIPSIRPFTLASIALKRRRNKICQTTFTLGTLPVRYEKFADMNLLYAFSQTWNQEGLISSSSPPPLPAGCVSPPLVRDALQLCWHWGLIQSPYRRPQSCRGRYLARTGDISVTSSVTASHTRTPIDIKARMRALIGDIYFAEKLRNGVYRTAHMRGCCINRLLNEHC